MAVTHVHRRGMAVLGVVLSLLVAACGNDPPRGDPPRTPSTVAPSVPHRTITLAPESPPPPGVHLSFIQQRLDEGTRRANISVTNGTGRVLQVRSVALDWPGYPGGAEKLAYPVPARSTIDLAYRLPRAVCTRAAGAARAHAIVTTPRTSIRRPLSASGTRFVTRLWDTACSQRRLRRTVSVGFGDPRTWSEHGHGIGASLNAQLVLDRASSDARVDVDQIQGSVLFDLTLKSVRPLASAARGLTLPLNVSPGRCDEHGLSQSQQTFVWRIWLKLDGGEPTSEILTPNRAEQARLLAFLKGACGAPGD